MNRQQKNKNGGFVYFFRSDLIDKNAVNVNVPHCSKMMCLNESSLDPYSTLNDQFQKLMQDIHINRYYSDITPILLNELAEYAQVSNSQLIMGNGADEMLYYLFTAVRDNDSSFALSFSPSYFDYASYCSATGLKIKMMTLNNDFSLDTQKFNMIADHPDCKLVIICNPNNPTGNVFPHEQIISIIEANPYKLVLIDETYFEFSGVSFSDYINKYNNLVIIRTFSKAFSAAGLRFGYLISNQDNITELNKVVTAFNLSIFVQAMALTILQNKDIFLNHNYAIIKQREWLFKQLQKLPGITPFYSHTNFITFKCNYSIDLFRYLIQNDIAVRYVGDNGILGNCLRVTVDRKEMNKEFLSKTGEFLNEKV